MTVRDTPKQERIPYNPWQEKVEMVLISNNNPSVAIVQGTTLGKKGEPIKRSANNVTERTGLKFTWTQ